MLLLGTILSGVIVFDVVLGFAKAWSLGKWDSMIARKGIVSHLGAIVFVYFIIIVEPHIHTSAYTDTIKTLIFFLIVAYGGSIIENLSELGVPFPDWITDKMKSVMKSEINQKHENVEEYDKITNDYKDLIEKEKEKEK